MGWASTCPALPSETLTAEDTRDRPVTFVSYISFYVSCRSHTRLLIHSAAIYSDCAIRSWGQRNWWSFFWGSCLWCLSMSSCTDAVAKSTQKGLKQLCCKLSTWKWYPSGSWCGPQRIIQQVCGKRKVKRVNIHIKNVEEQHYCKAKTPPPKTPIYSWKTARKPKDGILMKI